MRIDPDFGILNRNCKFLRISINGSMVLNLMKRSRVQWWWLLAILLLLPLIGLNWYKWITSQEELQAVTIILTLLVIPYFLYFLGYFPESLFMKRYIEINPKEFIIKNYFYKKAIKFEWSEIKKIILHPEQMRIELKDEQLNTINLNMLEEHEKDKLFAEIRKYSTDKKIEISP